VCKRYIGATGCLNTIILPNIFKNLNIIRVKKSSTDACNTILDPSSESMHFHLAYSFKKRGRHIIIHKCLLCVISKLNENCE
jgi:rRNA pseudouridine-1189 N-methylase Emg1 (Nep1/Mra1 family)